MSGVGLQGARTLLTGASSGIGRELALLLAARGARLVLAARREALLDTLADEIAAAGAARPVVVVADLSVPGAARELAAEAGPVDLLINNAGVSPIGTVAGLGDGDEARAAFETNVWSPIALAQALLPAMIEAGQGTIVNVSSTVQAVPIPFLGYYAASKSAIGLATRTLRNELRQTPIRVVEIVPGATDTPLRDVDLLPWRDGAPRTLPPIAPSAMATAIARALERGDERLVHPRYSLIPLELPIVGRTVARLATGRLNLSPTVPTST